MKKKKQFIGKNVVWDSSLSAISFLLSVILATYEDFFGIPGIVLKTLFVILGLFFTGKSIVDIISSKKNNYTYEDLLSDINKLNEIAHNHSIVLIKDSFQRFPNRFLVYEDKRWECKLFLNYKENPNNEEFIKNHLSGDLKIELDDINMSYLGQRIHEKYSESAKEEKVYCHKFYIANISQFPDKITKDSFEIDGKKYRWMTITELEMDEEVQKKNRDILEFVKELV